MRIPPNAIDEASLAAIGSEAVSLLCSGDIPSLVGKFGYALALQREPQSAVLQDLSICLSELQASALALPTQQRAPLIQYLQANTSNLFASIACPIPTNNGSEILLELIVTSKGSEFHVTLEQLSAAA